MNYLMLLLNPFKGLSLSNEECFENTIGFKCICLNVSGSYMYSSLIHSAIF